MIRTAKKMAVDANSRRRQPLVSARLDVYNDFADCLATRQTVIGAADVFKVKGLCVQQRFHRTGVDDIGQLRQYLAMLFTALATEHRQQHENDVQRQAFEMRR